MIGLLACFFDSAAIAQDDKKEPMDISNGFYMRWGPVFPLGNYSLGQPYETGDEYGFYEGYFNAAKIGISCEIGSHIYTGPSFANKYLRVGIDITYLNLWFNPNDASDATNWYWFAGQKAGPILTLSIPGGVMFDFGFKLSPIVGLTNDTWGRHLNQEIIMNFKFHMLQLSMQYCLGKINYTDFNEHTNIVDIPTFRLLLGMKFD